MFNQFPVPHIVIPDFLGTIDNKSVLEQIKLLDSELTQSTIFDHGHERVELSAKRNKNLWLDASNDTAIQLCGYFSKHFFDSKLVSWIKNSVDINYTTGSTTLFYNTLLSKYEPNDFYDWHVDVGGQVSWSYVCCNDSVTGGEFILSDAEYKQDRKNEIKIPCRNDTLIIFPAKFQHKVESIKTGCRYSVQLFFS